MIILYRRWGDFKAKKEIKKKKVGKACEYCEDIFTNKKESLCKPCRNLHKKMVNPRYLNKLTKMLRKNFNGEDPIIALNKYIGGGKVKNKNSNDKNIHQAFLNI